MRCVRNFGGEFYEESVNLEDRERRLKDNIKVGLKKIYREDGR
jgi:hypothetical protein